MKGKTMVLGLCMLCALAVSAVAAQSAMAIEGTTAFTCKEKVPAGGAGFSKAHCTPTDAVASGAKYEHKAIAEGLRTEIIGETTKTPGEGNLEARLHSVISGVNVELESKVVHGIGSMENLKDPTGEHYIHGEGIIQYTEVSVAKPTGKGCEVEGGKVETNTLTGTTTGQGDNLKFQPKEGGVFAKFNVKGCTGSKALEALNGPYEVTGSVSAPVIGATTTATAAGTTAQNTLKLRGQNAGIDGSLTISGRVAPEVTYTPLSATTVVT